MKPIIIIKETNKDGKFELTEKELKELIEQAYAQGVADEKKTQPNIGYRPKELDNGKRDMTTIGYPHDIYGNPIPYCGADTISDPKDNTAVATDDLVYRPSTAKWAKKGEPIPCELNQASNQPNPSITAWSSATSNSKQPNEDTYTLT